MAMCMASKAHMDRGGHLQAAAAHGVPHKTAACLVCICKARGWGGRGVHTLQHSGMKAAYSGLIGLSHAMQPWIKI